jgi:hypothetical protein
MTGARSQSRRTQTAPFASAVIAACAVVIALTAVHEDPVRAQDRRILSPPGHSAVQVGGNFDPVQYGYLGGAWIDVYYGRPLTRGRDLFGPPDWAEMLNDGAPVWRAGANQSTRLVTEAPLVIAGTRIEPGEYTLFIDLSDEAWTFIVSTWPAQETYDFENRDALFGAFEYTDDRDVLRTPMELETLPVAFEQLSWQFLDMTAGGGRLALIWGAKMATVRFTIAE